jgi:hypothetical protein
MMKCHEAHLNSPVDALAFLTMLVLASTCVFVRFVLPPGSGHGRTPWGLGGPAFNDMRELMPTAGAPSAP